MVAGSGIGAAGSFCMRRSMSLATELFRSVVAETSVRGARVPSSGSMVISSTIWASGAVLAVI